MAEEIDQQQSQKQSIFASALALQSTLLAYLKVRLQLLGQESKGAAINLGLVIGFSLFTAMLLFFCWPLFMVTFGFLMVELLGDYPVWRVFFNIFLLHIIFILVFILLAMWRMRKISLKRTLEEINKDREWINSLKDNV